MTWSVKTMSSGASSVCSSPSAIFRRGVCARAIVAFTKEKYFDPLSSPSNESKNSHELESAARHPTAARHKKSLAPAPARQTTPNHRRQVACIHGREFVCERRRERIARWVSALVRTATGEITRKLEVAGGPTLIRDMKAATP